MLDAPSRSQTFRTAWVANFLISVSWGMIFPLRNIYIHDQGIPLYQIGILTTAGSISYSLAGLLIGHLSDRFGKRRPLIILLLMVSILVSLSYLIANEFSHFLVLVLFDMGMLGGFIVLFDTLVSSFLPENQRGERFGQYRISGSIGYASSAALIGVVTENYGIRSIFIVSAIALLLALIAVSSIKEVSQEYKTETGAVRGSSKVTDILKSLLVAGLIWFVIADLVSMLGSQIAFPFQNIYIHETLHATAKQIGFLTTIGILAEIPSMMIAGNLSDKYGRGPVLIAGFLSSTMSWFLFFHATSLPPIYIAFGLNGICMIRHSVGIALITDSIPSGQRGTLIGISNLNYGIGGTVGPLIGAAIVDRGDISTTFLVAFFVTLSASLIYITRVFMERREHQNNSHDPGMM